VLRVPLLWTLMVPFALALAAQVGFLVHQISVLEPSLGESRAALTVSATTVAALLGRIVLGVLSDRVDLRKLSAVNIGAQGAALAAMATWPSPAVLVAASLVALGPGLMGVLHDALGSYQPAVWCLVVLETLAAVAVLWGRTLRDAGGLQPARGAAQAP
jgi:MFS family permease